MTTQTILVEREPPLFRITLNRPEVLNAINGQMLIEIREALDMAAIDPASKVVLIASSSDRAFCAGIDVAYVRNLSGFDIREVGRELHRTFKALRTIEKPVVTTIDGLCLGAGLEMAISCDFMIASDRSRFGLPNIDRGIPAIVEAAILPMVVGLQGTRELCYLGEFWDADRALERGLLHARVTASDLDAVTNEWCEKLASKPAPALATQKEIIGKWMTTDLETAIDYSINTVVLNFATREQATLMSRFGGEGRNDG